MKQVQIAIDNDLNLAENLYEIGTQIESGFSKGFVGNTTNNWQVKEVKDNVSADEQMRFNLIEYIKGKVNKHGVNEDGDTTIHYTSIEQIGGMLPVSTDEMEDVFLSGYDGAYYYQNGNMCPTDICEMPLAELFAITAPLSNL